jgi:hypothetical protein
VLSAGAVACRENEVRAKQASATMPDGDDAAAASRIVCPCSSSAHRRASLDTPTHVATWRLRNFNLPDMARGEQGCHCVPVSARSQQMRRVWPTKGSCLGRTRGTSTEKSSMHVAAATSAQRVARIANCLGGQRVDHASEILRRRHIQHLPSDAAALQGECGTLQGTAETFRAGSMTRNHMMLPGSTLAPALPDWCAMTGATRPDGF